MFLCFGKTQSKSKGSKGKKRRTIDERSKTSKHNVRPDNTPSSPKPLSPQASRRNLGVPSSTQLETKEKMVLESGGAVLAICGEADVGKEALMQRFLEGKFSPGRQTNNSQTARIHLSADTDILVHIFIIDTGGATSMTPEEQVQVYRSCTGFIMAFDMTDEMTLRMIPEDIKSVKRLRNGDQVPMILVGTKADMISCKEVDTDMVSEVLEEIGEDLEFYEVSSKDGKNVDFIFSRLLHSIYQDISETT